jgi:hypothetical protein
VSREIGLAIFSAPVRSETGNHTSTFCGFLGAQFGLANYAHYTAIYRAGLVDRTFTLVIQKNALGLSLRE